MNLTIDNFLGSEAYIGAVVDRAFASERDQILLTNYLSFEATRSRTFNSLYGVTTATRMGSVIDRNAPKPLRGRKPLGKATLEVADMGDRFQMDNDRLEQLRYLTDRLNRSEVNAEAVTNFLVEDFRELALAPYKRMEKVLFDLLYNGSASVALSDNPKGVSILDMNLPVITEKAKKEDKDHIIDFLVNVRNKYSYLNFGTMEMSQATFLKHFSRSSELMGKYKVAQGGTEVSITGTVPLQAVNAMLESLGLPTIRVITNIVTDLTGAQSPLAPDDKIVFLPSGELGKVRHYKPYELDDRIQGKTYSVREGDHMISVQRTDEGRFLEYGCSWIPEIRLPKHIVSIDLTAIK